MTDAVVVALIGAGAVVIVQVSGIAQAAINRRQSSREHVQTVQKVEEVHTIVNSQRTAMEATITGLQGQITALTGVISKLSPSTPAERGDNQ